MTTEYLIDSELEHVFAALMPTNRLVCEVCLHTGLRVGDVVALRSADVRRQFWITESKTGKRRRVNLPDDLLARLRAQAGKEFVFEGRRGVHSHRTRQAVWHDIKRASVAFRLPQNVGVHSLRKVYATRLLDRSGGDVARVQRALNHDSAATTYLYCMAISSYLAKYGPADGSGTGRRRRRRKI